MRETMSAAAAGASACSALWAAGLRCVVGVFALGALLIGLASLVPADNNFSETDGDPDAARRANWRPVRNLQPTADPSSDWVALPSGELRLVDVHRGQWVDRWTIPSEHIATAPVLASKATAVFSDQYGRLAWRHRMDSRSTPNRRFPVPEQPKLAAISATNQRVALATEAILQVWSVTDNPVCLAEKPRLHVSDLEWSPDGTWLLVVTSDGRLDVLDGATLERQQSTETSVRGFGQCVWSSSGTHAAAMANGGEISVWNLELNSVVTHICTTPFAIVFGLSADGQYLAVVDGLQNLWLIDVADTTQRWNYGELPAVPTALHFTADDRSFLVGLSNGDLQCWSAQAPRLRWRLSAHD